MSVVTDLKNRTFEVNIYTALALRLLLVMLMFSVCRIMFYLLNTGLFPDMTIPRFGRIMMGGLKFDLSATLYINILFILSNITPFKYRHNMTYQRGLRILFLVTNSIALAFNCADFIYYRFILKRTTSSLFESFANEEMLGSLFFQFVIDFWYVYLFWGIMVFVMVFLYNRVKIRKPDVYNNIVFYTGSVVMAALIGVLIVAGCRGGFRHSTRPITLSNAGKYVESPHEMAIVLNTPFAIIRTINKKPLKRVSYFKSDQELNAIYTPHHKGNKDKEFKNENVIVIILESFSTEYSGLLNPHFEDGNYSGDTPFLDSLMKESRTFVNSYANGLKTLDAVPSTLVSIPALQLPYVLSHHSHNRMNSLASLLKTKGYATSFFHGAPNGSMGFESFVNLAGYDKYYGKNEYGNDDDYDGIWGIWDEEFFQFFANTLNKEKQPFCTAIFSVSSHHPFKVPDKHEGTFKEGKFQISRTVRYTDYALKRFFETASKMDWYENTLFVITGDHTSPNFLFNRDTIGYFSVPLIFFKPGGEMKGFDETIVQQIDIMPTVLNYLNFDREYIAFGNDAFDGSSRHFAINYIHDSYQLFMDDYVMQFKDEEVIGLFDMKKDRRFKNNLVVESPEIRKKLEVQLKAILQQYNNRMLDNNITVKGPESTASLGKEH